MIVRLKVVGRTTLKSRRLRGDMIEVYKILNNLDDVEVSKFFQFSESVAEWIKSGDNLKS